MSNITVKIPSGQSYQVRSQAGLLDTVGPALRELRPDAPKVLVVSDTNVWPLYGTRVTESLRGAGFPTGKSVIQAGEVSMRI